jgi:hypothetical protein
VNYPRSTEVVIAPDGARLPAYAQPFRLVQDVAIVVNDQMRQLAQKPGAMVTLKGVLHYQSCAEGTCAAPQQVPFSWTLGLKPLG